MTRGPGQGTPALAATHDALLLDLDGTVYLGSTVIEHVSDALAAASALGARSMYVTNNASRPPAEVAAALSGMGIPTVDDDVLSSPDVAAEMLAATHPAGSKVLVVGAPWLAEAVRMAGLEPVRLFTDGPVAVVQGHSPETGWPQLAEACLALRAGADWVACNTDSTLPTDRGLLPGNGAMVAALVAATGLEPRVAGKPAPPLLEAAVRRSGAQRPLVVGDRLDTDIEAGVNAGMPVLMVLTGVSHPADLIAAPANQRPTYLGWDLRSLVDPARVIEVAPPAGPAGWLARDGVLTAPGGATPDAADSDIESLAALVAVANDAWSGGQTEAAAWRGADGRAQQVLDRLFGRPAGLT